MTKKKTTRTSPEVPEQLLNDFRTAIQVFNDGKLKGRFGPSVAEAMQLYIVAMYSRNPDRLKNMEDHVNPQEISELDSPDKHQTRVIEYQNGLSATMQDIALQLQRESPGGPTRFEQYVKHSDTSEQDSEFIPQDSKLDNSILG